MRVTKGHPPWPTPKTPPHPPRSPSRPCPEPMDSTHLLSGATLKYFNDKTHVGVAVQLVADGRKSYLMIPDIARVGKAAPVYITAPVRLNGEHLKDYLARQGREPGRQGRRVPEEVACLLRRAVLREGEHEAGHGQGGRRVQRGPRPRGRGTQEAERCRRDRHPADGRRSRFRAGHHQRPRRPRTRQAVRRTGHDGSCAALPRSAAAGPRGLREAVAGRQATGGPRDLTGPSASREPAAPGRTPRGRRQRRGRRLDGGGAGLRRAPVRPTRCADAHAAERAGLGMGPWRPYARSTHARPAAGLPEAAK